MYLVRLFHLTQREKYRLRTFENKALRKIFERRMDEVTGD